MFYRGERRSPHVFGVFRFLAGTRRLRHPLCIFRIRKIKGRHRKKGACLNALPLCRGAKLLFAFLFLICYNICAYYFFKGDGCSGSASPKLLALRILACACGHDCAAFKKTPGPAVLRAMYAVLMRRLVFKKEKGVFL